MTWTVWAAIVIVILTVAALIKRYETRLVLLASGFLMTCLSLDPMQGLNAFAKSMTNSGLIMAICSAMGFAFVVQMTKCDVHLVKLLSAPLSKLGLLLIPRQLLLPISSALRFRPRPVVQQPWGRQ